MSMPSHAHVRQRPALLGLSAGIWLIAACASVDDRPVRTLDAEPIDEGEEGEGARGDPDSGEDEPGDGAGEPLEPPPDGARGSDGSDDAGPGPEPNGSGPADASKPLTLSDGSSGTPMSEPKSCADQPCMNGGTCADGPVRFNCCCLPGFVGERCEASEPWTPLALAMNLFGENTVDLVVVDPLDSATIYAADGNGTTGDRLRQTLDRGEHWTELCESYGASAVALVPNEDKTLYIAPGAGTGIQKVAGQGASCRAIALGGYGFYTSVAVDPARAARVYAGSSRLSTNTPGVFRSLDSGATWVQVNTSLCVSSLIIDPAGGAVHAVGIEDWDVFGTPDENKAGVWRSTDDGKNWQPILRDRGPVHAYAMHRVRSASLLASTQHFGILYSEDHGASWHEASGADGIHVGALAWAPGDQGTAYAGTIDNGVYRSTDGGKTWSAFREGIVYETVHALEVDPNDSNIIYAGLETKGVYRRRLPGAAGACRRHIADPFCTNTCGSAGDGHCDDGGPRSAFATCELGSDCADCGTRAPGS